MPACSEPLADEFAKRNLFIDLDVRARRLGGVDKLFPDDQLEYLRIGVETGFLSRAIAKKYARELGLVL